MELVAKKCAIQTNGHFVFDRRPKSVHGAPILSGFSGIQTDILRLNVENQNESSLEIDLRAMDAIIQRYLKKSSEITNDTIQAYHDRSLLLYHMQRFNECIADATFIIGKCPFYSNAFMIRSRALLQEKRLYEAYDDILQACILEKFVENEINAMLSIIVKKIGEQWIHVGGRSLAFCAVLIRVNVFYTENSTGEDHGGKSFAAYKKPYEFPASQWTEAIHLWKATNNYIMKTFPQPCDDKNPIGFRSAINALHRNQYLLIVPACEVEIMLNGVYVDESRLLRAQMHHLMLPFGSTAKQLLIDDLSELKKILMASQPRDDDLMFETKLLISRIFFTLEQYETDVPKYNTYSIFDSEPTKKRKGIADFWLGYDMCSTYQPPEILEGLKLLRRSVEMVGKKFFIGQFYEIVFTLTSDQFVSSASGRKSTSSPVDDYISRLNKLHLFFLNEIQPVQLMINYYLQNKAYRVAAIYVQTLAKLSQPSCNGAPKIVVNANENTDLDIIIEYLKSVIRDDPKEYAAYDALIGIYWEKTHEYSKCLEVLSKAMTEMCDQRLYRQLFQRRQKLLFSIAAANFWPELN